MLIPSIGKYWNWVRVDAQEDLQVRYHSVRGLGQMASSTSCYFVYSTLFVNCSRKIGQEQVVRSQHLFALEREKHLNIGHDCHLLS